VLDNSKNIEMNVTKMTWLDLYNYLHERANDVKNLGSFPWQETVEVFDWETLNYYPTDFIIMPADNKISLAVDTYQPEDK
jgi:hypothetical protein